ncbi:vacuolar protein sorting-associated protein 33B [Thrips palmi]|uniref:Vacuolar protein sorting-associated protein 33B n=1 Tax=Thrips palmi TaxID=161013 RepID=A0A6P8YZX8_THRPL|nr:vacuolar protein sorting-associated protein 33B [Thrips palmi]XP_034239843.1 vacuolar protein sorting-associated protein 33B [Thrips palmi]
MQMDGRLTALRELSQLRLINIFNQIPGKKDLIIDAPLMKALDRITGISVLRKHDVDKIFKLDSNAGQNSVNNQRLYLIMSDLISAKRVCDQVNAEQRKDVDYHIIVVPRKLAAIDQLLEEEGLWGRVTIHVYQWEPIQLDMGLISLELPSLFPQLFVDGDQTLLPAVAKSLWSLQMLLGRSQVTLTLGRYAKQVQSMTEVLMDQIGEPDKPQTDIGCIVLVDRDVDYAASLLTPATYTSLMDEVLGIRSGVVELPKSDAKPDEKQTIGHLLSSEDEIYNQIKNRHFSDVFSFLSAKAKQLSNEYDQSRKMALHEMKQYVSSQLKTVMARKRALAMHIAGCEAVITAIGARFESLQDMEQNMLEGTNRRSVQSYIEENIVTGGGGKLANLRLMCLLSLTQDGLFSEDAWSLKTQFLHAYGYHLLPGLHNLENLGLLTTSSAGLGSGLVTGPVSDATGRLANKVAQVVSLPKRSSFQVLRQKLKLFSANREDINLKQPTDMSYVYGGAYIPIACQLVQLLIKKEVSFEDIVNQLIPGSSVTPSKPSIDFLPRSFIVYFIGGVTYAEVAAFQLLEKLTGTRIIVASTSVMNGSTLIDSVL